MIVVEHVIPDAGPSESIPTLVTISRIPNHYLALTYASLIFSTLALAFSLLDMFTYAAGPKFTAPIIIAYLLLLPYHGAALLLEWLTRHQTASILSFAPASPRAIGYIAALCAAWVAAAGVSIMRLYTMLVQYDRSCPVTTWWNTPCGWAATWPSAAAMAVCAVEVLLLGTIGILCWKHPRAKADAVDVVVQRTTREKVVSP